MTVSGVCDPRDMTYRSIPSAARLCVYSTRWLRLEMWNLYHFSSSTSKRPSAQKYNGMYSSTEANNANHSQIYSPARRSPGNEGLSQHQYYLDVPGENRVRKRRC